ALVGAVFLLEAGDVFRLPLRQLDVAVLLLLARGGALDADPRVVAHTDVRPVLIRVDGFVRLVERAPAAEAALLLDDLLQIRLRLERVAELHGAHPLVARAGPDRVHARQALGQPAVADGAQRVHALHDDRGRDQRAPARAARVVLVEVHRVQIADGVRQ